MEPDTELLLIAERAAEWLVRLDSADAKERAEFSRWLCDSPVHMREMLAAMTCHLVLNGLCNGRPPTTGDLRHLAGVY
jgi:ferric-dicitrate binding protein FerR (iron transport regulator)